MEVNRLDPRIIPLNLPAELDREIPGNPVSSRPESAIANCYPGLEVDVRNLDRRFFPGLVFDFVAQPDDGSSATMRGGALLVEVDPSDPDLPKDPPDLKKSLASLQKMMAVKSVFLDSITAGQGKCIKLHDGDGHPYDWDVTWRIVRSTPPGSITIELVICDGVKKSPLMTLQADRRQYQNKDGELSQVYRPGELSQALCSPWQHDFRDCACTYWLRTTRTSSCLRTRPALRRLSIQDHWLSGPRIPSSGCGGTARATPLRGRRRIHAVHLRSIITR
jgi:hypothetical protein